MRPVKRVFRAYGGFFFCVELYRLDWHRFLFWRVLYHRFVKEPILQRLYKRGWRFLRYLEILELELTLDGWGPLLRRIFRPVTRPVVRFYYRLRFRIKLWRFLLFTPRGRYLFKLLRRRHRLNRQLRRRMRRQLLALSWRQLRLRAKFFLWDCICTLKIAS